MHEELLTQVIRLEDDQHEFNKAITLLQDLIKRDPTCIEAYIHLAADSGIIKNFSQAEQFAKIALNLDQNSGRARYYLACALRAQGRYDEAYIEMEQALIQVRKAAVKGTGAEAKWERFPLFGWNKHVEDDAIALRAWVLRRTIDSKIKNISIRLQTILHSIGIGRK